MMTARRPIILISHIIAADQTSQDYPLLQHHNLIYAMKMGTKPAAHDAADLKADALSHMEDAAPDYARNIYAK
ncbi:hypothetical protein NOR_05295 [Metarhizium rileyi]|uniref:Uncharacterized protein n=1 Tax=Metarhizium rileyi (strain RCEF 4871) TaxID=1649241 RepID=A0A167D080_METRR|nr:hypothetical protein NOR_05295 [Metarhizium rileyi RCEF 4871]